MWTEIDSQSDIEKLLDLYGSFHDSCVRDIYLTTREFIDEKLSMHFENKLVVLLLFQRQYKLNPVLELKFEEVQQFNFRPYEENESAIIYDVTLKMENGIFYWADFSGWQIGDNDSIWISGKKLFWRLRPELIGNVRRINDE